jgi:ketosteroid isomerase-like protein
MECRIGAQDIEAIVTRILDDAIVVDLKMLLVGRLQITTIG